MRYFLIPLSTLAFVALLTGCSSFWTAKTAANSYPVELGIATTNDTAVAAWLTTLKTLNNEFNPTPTEQPISVILASLIGLTAAAGGYALRHSIKPKTKTPVDTPEAK